jgi:hypothetical protein
MFLDSPRYKIEQQIVHPYLGDVTIKEIIQEDYSYSYIISHKCCTIKGYLLKVTEKALYYDTEKQQLIN